MSEQTSDLLLFVSLLAKEASHGDERQVRERLSSDPRLLKRWNQVRLAFASGRLDEPASAPDHAVSAERTAAFIEGKLPTVEADQFEQQCWESPALLAEVVSVYRSTFEPVAHASVPSSLTSRLLALYDSDTTASEPEAWNEPAFVDASPPVIATVGRDHGKRERPKRSRRVWVGSLMAAAVAGIGLLMAFLPGETTDSKTETLQVARHRPEPTQPTVDAALTPEAPSPVAVPLDSATEVESEAAFVDEEGSKLVEPIQPEVFDPKETLIQRDEPPRSVPNPAVNGEVHPSPATLQWTAITGLVAKRDRSDGIWSAVEAQESVGTGQTVSALPDSWALAQLWCGGELVLGPDSKVTLGGDSTQPSAIVCELAWGRVAFRNLNSDVQIRLNLGPRSSTIRPEKNGLTIAVERIAHTPRVQVISGTASVSGKRIGQGQQVRWSRTGSISAEPIGGEIEWVRRPESNRSFPRSLQAQFRNQGTLEVFLKDLRGNEDPSLRELATRSQLAMFAHGSSYALLNSTDEVTRIAALDWIRARRPKDPRLAHIARSLAEGVGNPTIARRMVNWMRLSGQSARTDRSVASELLRALDHRELAVRQIACYVLRMKTGRQVPYKPNAPAAARRAGVQRWRRVVAEVYGSRANRTRNKTSDRTNAVKDRRN